jgi:hypothetical protein
MNTNASIIKMLKIYKLAAMKNNDNDIRVGYGCFFVAFLVPIGIGYACF